MRSRLGKAPAVGFGSIATFPARAALFCFTSNSAVPLQRSESPQSAKTGREQLQHMPCAERQSYSITSSARNKSDVGMDIPSA